MLLEVQGHMTKIRKGRYLQYVSSECKCVAISMTRAYF